MSLQQLAILSSIAFMVESTEASPFWKRATTEDETKSATKKVQKAAVTDDDNKFSNKPTESKDATTKKATTTKASAKSTSAKPSSSAAPKPSSAVSNAISSSAIASPTPTPVVPPLMVTSTPSTASGSSSPSAIPSTAADSNSSGGVSGGAIGGIVSAIIIIILGAVAYIFVRRRKNQQQRNRHLSNKPDPFTMGYGSDQAFHAQPPMQQQQPTYQHQYGAQPSIAVTSPTSPTSPYYDNAPFSDANNHIIAESMIPAVLPKSDAPYQQDQQQYQQQQQYQDQQYQSQLQPQPQQAQFQQTQPQQPIYQPQPQQTIPTIDSNNTLVAASAGAGAGAAIAAIASTNNNTLLSPTQPGSVGVFHVAATYTPTLSDEIDIQTGDQVEVLVEYDDGWCQGINLTRGNAKGVFPKHCIDFSSGNNAPPSIATSNSSEVDRVKRVSSMYIA